LPSCSSENTMTLTGGGCICTCGDNDNRQLGHGDRSGKHLFPVNRCLPDPGHFGGDCIVMAAAGVGRGNPLALFCATDGSVSLSRRRLGFVPRPSGLGALGLLKTLIRQLLTYLPFHYSGTKVGCSMSLITRWRISTCFHQIQ
jgi:hypothetical protein